MCVHFKLAAVTRVCLAAIFTVILFGQSAVAKSFEPGADFDVFPAFDRVNLSRYTRDMPMDGVTMVLTSADFDTHGALLPSVDISKCTGNLAIMDNLGDCKIDHDINIDGVLLTGYGTNLEVQGAVNAKYNIVMSGMLQVHGDLSTAGFLVSNVDAVLVDGKATIGYQLRADGSCSFAELEVSSATVRGFLTTSGDIHCSYELSAGDVDCGGSLKIDQEDLTVGSATIAGDCYVENSVFVTEFGASVGGNLTTHGSITCASRLNVTGDISVGKNIIVGIRPAPKIDFSSPAGASRDSHCRKILSGKLLFGVLEESS